MIYVYTVSFMCTQSVLHNSSVLGYSIVQYSRMQAMYTCNMTWQWRGNLLTLWLAFYGGIPILVENYRDWGTVIGPHIRYSLCTVYHVDWSLPWIYVHITHTQMSHLIMFFHTLHYSTRMFIENTVHNLKTGFQRWKRNIFTQKIWVSLSDILTCYHFLL